MKSKELVLKLIEIGLDYNDIQILSRDENKIITFHKIIDIEDNTHFTSFKNINIIIE